MCGAAALDQATSCRDLLLRNEKILEDPKHPRDAYAETQFYLALLAANRRIAVLALQNKEQKIQKNLQRNEICPQVLSYCIIALLSSMQRNTPCSVST